MKKLENFVPVGRDYRADIRIYLIGLSIAILFSFSYFFGLAESYKLVADGEWLWMEPFTLVLGNGLGLFPILSVLSLIFIISYYQMHCGSAKTLYLMRRLPDRWSLYRRCITLPILMAVFSLLMMVLLFGLYFWIYYWVTPEEALYPNQVEMLLGNWFHGETLWRDGVAVRWE